MKLPGINFCRAVAVYKYINYKQRQNHLIKSAEQQAIK